MLQSSKDNQIAQKSYYLGLGLKYHIQLIQDIDQNDPLKIQLCIIIYCGTYGLCPGIAIKECFYVNGAKNFKNVELRMFSEPKTFSELSNFKAEVLM